MKTKKRKLNVRLLRKIQKHILEEPRRFFMQGMVATGKPNKAFEDYYSDLARTAPTCGTAACIAGWTALLSGKTPKETSNISFDWCADKLGLPRQPFADDFRSTIFLDSDWPQPYSRQYESAKTPARRAKIACARIDHLIKTGE